MLILKFIIVGIVVAAAIAFISWFFDRTPDNLQGFYVIPVIIAVSILLILLGISMFAR